MQDRYIPQPPSRPCVISDLPQQRTFPRLRFLASYGNGKFEHYTTLRKPKMKCEESEDIKSKVDRAPLSAFAINIRVPVRVINIHAARNSNSEHNSMETDESVRWSRALSGSATTPLHFPVYSDSVRHDRIAVFERKIRKLEAVNAAKSKG